MRLFSTAILILYILGLAFSAKVPPKPKLPKIPKIVYQSRPDLYPPKFNVSIYKPDKVADGYYFIAPYGNDQAAPYIYDKSGTLIWSGFGIAGPGNFTDFRTIDYLGASGKHLSVYAGVQSVLGGQGQGRGHGVILDDSYHFVASTLTDLGRISSDQHEVNVLPGGKTAILSIYQPYQYDLSQYGVKGIGWLSASVFQEIDLATGRAIFEWNSADHVPPSDSYVPIGKNTSSPTGDGTTAITAWDYFHVNAIDKTSDGNYLVNSRHTWTTFKVSGKDGSVIWRLGGKKSTFKREGYDFSWQHDARERESNKTHTILSLFDNASNGKISTRNYSAGLVIAIDYKAGTSYLLKNFSTPDKIQSDSQGDLQLLPSGNAVIGWGQNAFITEHTPDGETVFYANFNYTGTQNYRAFKYPWVGQPKETPALFAYSSTTTSPTDFYISWNGATEVKTWNIYVSNEVGGPYKLSTSIPKKGFETVYTSSQGYTQWSYIEAVNQKGQVLNKSRKVKTYVPKEEVKGQA